jgi:acyl-CoA synthetase (AMP-forming)/AMP-acid ligase II
VTHGLPADAVAAITSPDTGWRLQLAQNPHALCVDGDTVLTVLPLFHVGGLCIQTLPALSVGAHVRLFARFDAAATLECIATRPPTLTLQVPATLKALTEHPQWAATDLSSLRAVWAGSSLLPPAPLAAFHGRGVPVCNVYGSTETGPFSIALPPEHAQSHAGSCGWPAPGVEVQLRDTSGAAVGTGGVGEICVRGPNVVRHYWPERPACDAEGFFHSGDLGQQAPDGSVTVVGRAKDMVISGGENIYPAEIENLLQLSEHAKDCAGKGAEGPPGGAAAGRRGLRPGLASASSRVRVGRGSAVPVRLRPPASGRAATNASSNDASATRRRARHRGCGCARAGGRRAARRRLASGGCPSGPF